MSIGIGTNVARAIGTQMKNTASRCRLLLAALVLFLPSSAAAAPIFSNVVDTPNELSYDIGGTIRDSFDLLKAIAFGFDNTFPWAVADGSSATFELEGDEWGVVVRWQHEFIGNVLTLDSGLRLFGTEYSDFTTVSHGTAFDSLSIRLQVDAPVDFVSSISGRLELIHREEVPPVPEPGVVALLGLGLAGFGYRRRK